MRLRTWSWVRVAVALLIVCALVGQLWTSVDAALTYGRNVPTTVINFFSFFTVLSNVGAAITLGWAGGLGLRRQPRTAWPPATLVACITTAMIITGIVYNLLLRGVELPQGTTLPWSNEVLHVVAPVFLLLDLLLAPAPKHLRWPAIGWILAYPLAWTVYTLVRGPLVTNPATGAPTWYPYPFLNPQLVPGGWAGVAGYVAAISLAMGLVGAGVIATSRRRAGAHPG